MAEMIPDRLPARATTSERRLFAALERLPADCLVYFEPVVANGYPDFIVIAPSLGVLTIELKGWRAGDIAGADTITGFHISRTTRIEPIGYVGCRTLPKKSRWSRFTCGGASAS